MMMMGDGNKRDEEVEALKGQLQVARNEINNLRQQLKALTVTNKKDCEEIRQKLQNFRCETCTANAGEAAASVPPPTFEYIGVISTQFPEKRGTPRQPGICSSAIAKVTLNIQVFTNPEHALEGLQEYSHMWILFHFHKNDSTHIRAKVSPPRLNGIKTGVFATRSPHRPCPIGLSLVKIDRIMDNTIYFSGVDMVDQTPVLDIKPYIPQYDSPLCLNSPFPEEYSRSQALRVSESDDNDVQENVRIMDGEEFNAAPENHPRYNSMSEARMGEREAPDGEEEELPAASAATPSDVRVPAWIDEPPVRILHVMFKERALAQLQELGSEGEGKKTVITNVLKEDPRSVYLRQKWGSHCYVFRIAELYVSCKFNQSAHSVTVYQVFQNEVPNESE